MSQADYDARRKEIIRAMTGTDVASKGSPASEAPPPAVLSPSKVVTHSQVAPAAREPLDPRFGGKPQNTMEKGQRPEDPFRLEHDPYYPFGPDKAGVGDADQLQSFLDDLEIKLQGERGRCNSSRWAGGVGRLSEEALVQGSRRTTRGTRRSRTSCRAG